jgi:quinoprotein relay system zinc metallohydrolase 2
MVRVAEGVYVHLGAQENSSSANHGDIANIGFVVGTKCVAVIDTGGTAEVGQALRLALRRVTSLPVCYVINTHVHPDHIFGNAAFMDDHPQFVGHVRLTAAMSARGPNYANALKRDLGELAAGSEIIAPNLPVADEMTLDLGGRALKLRAWPTAHTDNDLTVYDEKTATLWLADLLFVERIPVVDGSLRGWLAVIRQLRAMKARHIIPGHGRIDPAWPQALDAEARYLGLLASEVRAAIKGNKTMQQAVDTVGLSERDKWPLFDSFHRRNITAAYAELEWED